MRYQLTRSNRKTIGIQVKDGQVIVRAPQRMPQSEIEKFLLRSMDWINKQIRKQEELKAKASANPVERLTMQELEELAKKAMKVIPERVAYYAPKVGVTYGRITIRNQKSRWGSCSAKGNLNFNCLLMLAPPEVIDSVVVHELCHRIEMNHSKKFYEHVLRVYPDYYKHHAWLKEHGPELMRRMLG